jgi:hypothetical protein
MKLDSIAKAYLTQCSSISQLDEQLLPKEEHEADMMRSNGHAFYQQKFIDSHPRLKELMETSPYMDSPHQKRQFAARVPVELDVSSKAPHPEVANFLKQNGYHFTDDEYKQGIANKTVTVGNPDKGIPYTNKIVSTKIGSLLDKHSASDSLKKNFINDPFRTNAKTKAYDIVLTGNHRDIYGSSTGRSYTSCADKRPRKAGEIPGLNAYDGDGPAAQKMREEINNNTFNAYLIPRGGNIDTDVIGRISFKKHTGLTTGHQTLFPEKRQYGTGVPNGFREAAEKLVSSVVDKTNDAYLKNKKVYNDDGEPIKISGSSVTGEQLDAANKELKGDEFGVYRRKLMEYVDPNQKYKTKKFRDLAKIINQLSDTIHGSGKYSSDLIKTSPDYANAIGAGDRFLTALHHFRELHTIIDDSFDTASIKDNPHINKLMDDTAELFDMNNMAHRNAVVSAAKPSFASKYAAFANAIASRATKNKTIKNYSDFENMVYMRDASNGHITFGGANRYSALPVHPDHTLGKNPMDTAVRNLSERGLLSHDSLRAAYMTFGSKSKNLGNLYDVAHHYEKEGLNDMGDVITNLAAPFRRRPSSELAETFLSMKPSTRERFASELHDYIGGMTGRQFMNAHKEHLDAYKARRQEILDAVKKQNLEEEYNFLSEEYFDYEDDEEERDFGI